MENYTMVFLQMFDISELFQEKDALQFKNRSAHRKLLCDNMFSGLYGSGFFTAISMFKDSYQRLTNSFQQMHFLNTFSSSLVVIWKI